MNSPSVASDLPLPPGVRSRLIDNHNGCLMHVLEAGWQSTRPCVLLLHGFPELAFSWRGQMTALADAGFHVIAPDLRGYGRSGGTDVGYDDDLFPYSPVNRVADALGLVRALGHESVAAVVGHDFGAHVAGWCALLRPDVFRSVVFMSATFPGAPLLPLGADAPSEKHSLRGAIAGLASLDPPRKHYWRYYATREANSDMLSCPQGVHDFLRAYFHVKSGDWAGNRPFPLEAWTPGELAKLPRYYVMDAGADMAQTAAANMPTPAEIAACQWMPQADLRVYSAEYARTGFQGGLQSYRLMVSPLIQAQLHAFSGRTIDVPACYISGDRDWGTWQVPGGLDLLTSSICTRMKSVDFVAGAGHWVQQEAADQVSAKLLAFLT
jgi:pimeloyl-ACP methyl ester carboxylesterase